jgi:hypothetical protein
MNDFEINDKRIQKDFASISFSGYKKLDVKKQLIKSILDGRIEQSNYWAAELICSGHFSELWEIILKISSKNIHHGNPKLPIYLEMRINNFKVIVDNGYVDNEIKMRNNIKIRNLFCEIICILCFSQKKHAYDSIKINKEEFDISEISYKLKADSLNYITPIFMKDDPKECFIAGNELAYNITEKNRNTNEACYWLEWISEFESLCKKKKEIIKCERRSNIPVESKNQMDLIWIVWDIILHETTKRDELIRKIIKSLLSLFCLKYSNNNKKKRKYIIYYAIALLTEKVDFSISLNNQPILIEKIQNKLNTIYKEIKKNEVKPETDYLFSNLGKSNLDKTIEKLEKMQNFDFIPRK